MTRYASFVAPVDLLNPFHKPCISALAPFTRSRKSSTALLDKAFIYIIAEHLIYPKIPHYGKQTTMGFSFVAVIIFSSGTTFLVFF
jgi:hypothetical protein